MAQRNQIGQWQGSEREWQLVVNWGRNCAVDSGGANKNSKFCFLNHGPDVLRRGQEGIKSTTSRTIRSTLRTNVFLVLLKDSE